ncbi:MAG TPA: CotH kinase family protein [Verrucomicrobiae bacterium]|nr:CotH kinase family protein [Verrucomicrobiae bacterium]
MLGLFAVPARAGVVINEVMYHPPDERDDLQYIELHNSGSEAVNISGWSFAHGIEFKVPANTDLPAGDFAIICRDARAFAAQYGNQAKVIGVFKGKLSHGGEKLELVDTAGKRVDFMKYADRAPWPLGPDGGSASLERICPAQPGEDVANWAGSRLPSSKRPAGTPGRTNDTYSARPLPLISEVKQDPAVPNKEVAITATVADKQGVKTVSLAWWASGGDARVEWTQTPMTRVSGDAKQGSYRAVIPAQAQSRLVRYAVLAENEDGAVRSVPSPNEPRPAYSYHTFVNTNTAAVPFFYVLTFGVRERSGPSFRNGRGDPEANSGPARGASAVFYAPPGGKEVQAFDYVHVRPRGGGFKVHFLKDQPLNGMTGINVLYDSAHSVLCEPLAYSLYRLAGVPAPLTDHFRVWVDGRQGGLKLVIEQPNKTFLRRIGRDEGGNLYKILWYESGVVRQHEKKTNLRTGHADIINAVETLNRTSGAAQWKFIQENFNVEECINYYAVCMCVQNWDGFFNNHYPYHDLRPGGKWEIFPWDNDKTWGAYDGGPSDMSWYDMPLTFGMNGDQEGGGRGIFGGGRFFGGNGYWRPPGWFSGPLLANPEFRAKFLARLREICETIFTPEKMEPYIASMENKLGPEILARADARREDRDSEMQEFKVYIDSFRKQVVNRRKYILRHIIEGR